MARVKCVALRCDGAGAADENGTRLEELLARRPRQLTVEVSGDTGVGPLAHLLEDGGLGGAGLESERVARQVHLLGPIRVRRDVEVGAERSERVDGVEGGGEGGGGERRARGGSELLEPRTRVCRLGRQRVVLVHRVLERRRNRPRHGDGDDDKVRVVFVRCLVVLARAPRGQS